jgi:hypothetical protein
VPRVCRTQANSLSEKPAAANALAARLNSFSPSNMPTRTSGYSRSSGFSAAGIGLSLRHRDSHLDQNPGFPSAVLHRAPLTSHLLSDLLVCFFNRLVPLAHAPEPSQGDKHAKHRQEDPLVSHKRLEGGKENADARAQVGYMRFLHSRRTLEIPRFLGHKAPVLLRSDFRDIAIRYILCCCRQPQPPGACF